MDSSFLTPLGRFKLLWQPAGFYDVFLESGSLYGSLKHVCQVHPYKQEQGTLGDPKKMFTVKAIDYPGVGKLEQMVKGADLLEYLDSVRMGRGY